MPSLGRQYVIFFCLALGMATIPVVAYEPSWTPPTVEEVTQALEGLSFEAFVEESFQQHVLRFPEDVTRFGASSLLGVRDDLLREFSESYLAETRAIEALILAELQGFLRAELDAEQQLLYDVCSWYWQDLVDQHAFAYPIDFFLYPTYPSMLPDHFLYHQPLLDKEDVASYLCKLEQIDRQLDEITSEMRRYAAAGVLPSRGHLAWARSDLIRILQHTEYTSPFFTALRDRIDGVDELDASSRQDRLREAAKIIGTQVQPAYRRFSAVLLELMDAAPSEGSLVHVHDGEAFYAYCLQHYVQTPLTGAQLHDLGLRYVRDAEAALRTAADEWGISGSLSNAEIAAAAAELSGTLEGAEILQRYQQFIDLGKEHSIDLVGFFPEEELCIVGADKGGMYFDAAADDSRQAVFIAKTLGAQSAYMLPLIAFHEAYPGHHLQHAIAHARNLPLQLQKSLIGSYSIGFVEGWAFYVEMLTSELGWYDEIPGATVGLTQYDLVRSVAIVANTGLHALGWTEAETLDYYIETLGLSEHGAKGYIYGAHLGLPGHYLGYKIGGVAIHALRESAEDALGEDFSLAEFHDAVLEHGILPLHILEQGINVYIEEKLGE